MQKQNITRFDSAYKIRMVTIAVFLIGCSCLLIFWVRIFDKWDKAPIVAVKGSDKPFLQQITYIVNEKEYTCEYSIPNDSRGKYFYVGDYMTYLVSNPAHVFPERTLPLIILSISEVGLFALAIGLTVLELKRRNKKC